MVRFFLQAVAVVSFFVVVPFSYGDYPSEKQYRATVIKESGGNTMAIGDKFYVTYKKGSHGEWIKVIHHRLPSEWAYGDLQIRQMYCDDVNRRYGTNYESKNCLGDSALSKEIYLKYMSIYLTNSYLGHIPTDDDAAGIHNGGPNGWRSHGTASYRRDVKKIRSRIK